VIQTPKDQVSNLWLYAIKCSDVNPGEAYGAVPSEESWILLLVYNTKESGLNMDPYGSAKRKILSQLFFLLSTVSDTIVYCDDQCKECMAEELDILEVFLNPNVRVFDDKIYSCWDDFKNFMPNFYTIRYNLPREKKDNENNHDYLFRKLLERVKNMSNGKTKQKYDTLIKIYKRVFPKYWWQPLKVNHGSTIRLTISEKSAVDKYLVNLDETAKNVIFSLKSSRKLRFYNQDSLNGYMFSSFFYEVLSAFEGNFSENGITIQDVLRDIISQWGCQVHKNIQSKDNANMAKEFLYDETIAH
jgi:hypothetical protein